MKTYPRIPFFRAIKLRPRASPLEAERYFQVSFEQDLDDWLTQGIKAPSNDSMSGALADISLKKLDCVSTSLRCHGMNKKVYSGDFDLCGKLAPFYIWRRYINETDHDDDVNILMDQYNFEPFDVPLGAE